MLKFEFQKKETQRDSGAYSSGHGSDENGSIYIRPQLRLFSTSSNRNRNRESFSASSGYESASGDSKNNHGKLKFLFLNFKILTINFN